MPEIDKPAPGPEAAPVSWPYDGSGHRWGLVVKLNVLDAERMENMKTYCKRLVVSNVEKIFDAITEYMHDKYRKNSTVRFYSCYTGYNKKYIKEHMKPHFCVLKREELDGYRGNFEDISEDQLWKYINLRLATDMADAIRNRTVKDHICSNCYGLPVIRYEKIIDPGSGKERMLGLEVVLFRLYEQVAQKAASPMFEAKLGTYQVASVKERGQNYGKKAIKRWLATDVDGTRYNIKADVRHCYPSIPHNRLRELLHRDLKKCDDLLYLFDLFIDFYEEWPNPEAEAPNLGILIGSPVSKDLCNYYLSYAYHYADEKLVKKICRRGRETVKRLIKHQIFYMDDITMYGSNKKDITQALEILMKYMKDFLGLILKWTWAKSKSMYEGKDERIHGNILDYMGFRFHGSTVKIKRYFGREVKVRKVWTTIRRRIFLKARRKLSLFERCVRRKVKVSIKRARSITSLFGWYKNSNMVRYRKRNKIDRLMKIARKIVSDFTKGKEEYNTEKYYKMWRRLYA